ncbi:hypothetical protein [Helicobacter sp. 23-1045]
MQIKAIKKYCHCEAIQRIAEAIHKNCHSERVKRAKNLKKNFVIARSCTFKGDFVAIRRICERSEATIHKNCHSRAKHLCEAKNL